MIKIKKVLVTDYISRTKIPCCDYAINPYIGCPHKCMYCYAEFMKQFTNHNEHWGDFLDVKVCQNPFNIKKLIGKSVIIGTVTDAYNRYEEEYQITRKLLESLIGVNTEISILTKSELVIRDIDLFKNMINIEITFSMNTLDDIFRKDTEPCTSKIIERIEALKILNKNGIKTSVFLSPMFPGITDFKLILKSLKDYCQSFWFENLKLYPHCASRILKYIHLKFPHLKNLYYDIYIAKNTDYWDYKQKEIVSFCQENSIDHMIYFYLYKTKKNTLTKNTEKPIQLSLY
ncbi:MAG: radical SAM protein [Endomicrobium sp.]|jgi:DNA repair photolyase|nr:radical SAM protein [Endomicrobium sp.]MDR2399274.1 radical SAM protein [Endomicrobium sp.]